MGHSGKFIAILGASLVSVVAFQNCSQVAFEQLAEPTMLASTAFEDQPEIAPQVQPIGQPTVATPPPAPVVPTVTSTTTPAATVTPVVAATPTPKICPEFKIDFANAIDQELLYDIPVSIPSSDLFNDVSGGRGQTWHYSNEQIATKATKVRLYGHGNTAYKLNGVHVALGVESFCDKQYGENWSSGRFYGRGYWVKDIDLKAGDKIQLGLVSSYAGDVTAWSVVEIDGLKKIFKVRSFDYETIGGRNWNKLSGKSTGMQSGMKCSGGELVGTITYNKTDRQHWGTPKSCLDIAQAGKEINCVQDHDRQGAQMGYCTMYKNARHVTSGDPQSSAAAYLQ